ncbi:MAG: hypothetical protein ACR2M1_00350 [Gemmatimonadaceae bacterium]
MQGLHAETSVLDATATRVRGREALSLPPLALVGPLFLLVVATALWLVSLRSVEISRMNDLGLISVLRPPTMIAFLLLTASFCGTVCQRQVRGPLVLAHLVILVGMLYGTTTLVEHTMHLSTAYRHVGLTEYIVRHGRVDPTFETYFNWPGFFITAAFFTRVAGFHSALSLTPWSSALFNLLYLGPIIMIFRASTDNQRHVWLGAWFFFVTNWVGQDYFAPQAATFFFYLVIIAILLTWFKAARAKRGVSPRRWPRPFTWRFPRFAPDGDTAPSTPSTRGQRSALVIILVALLGVVVGSHTLTPFLIFIVLVALVLWNRVTLRGMPLVLLVMLCAWISFMATAFFAGHTSLVTGDVGQVDQNVGANVGNRLGGSPDHLLVVRVRLLLTAIVWGLALLGGARRFLGGKRDLTLVLLAIAPFSLLALQAYGGEMILRVYFFTLPPVLFFAAALFVGSHAMKYPWLAGVAIGATTVLLTTGFMFARYGNERMDYFTTQEVDAVRQLYAIAPPGSLLVAAEFSAPLGYENFEQYPSTTLGAHIIKRQDTDAVLGKIEEARTDHNPVYLIVTRSQRAQVELFDGLPPGTLESLERTLIASGRFQVRFTNPDATIYALVEPDPSGVSHAH